MAREMDECPFCGEPIEPEAEFCRHCGSDAETGWNPDADYESLELPEDDEEEPAPPPARTQVPLILGPAAVVAAWLAFVLVASSRFDPPGLVFLPAIYLAACILIQSRLAPKAAAPAGRR
jgi:hypothetical protein